MSDEFIEKHDEEALATPRSVKTRATRERIYLAAVEIMKKHGYEYLSVKNVCQAAGISNGAFFYHFQTKEKLLSYYLNERFSVYRESVGFKADELPHFERLLAYYKCYADYAKESGVEFISSYYVAKNKALNTRRSSEASSNSSEVVRSFTVPCMMEAWRGGLLRPELDPVDCVDNCCTILKGIILDWALSDGRLDMRQLIDDILGSYLETLKS